MAQRMGWSETRLNLGSEVCGHGEAFELQVVVMAES